MQCSMWCGCVVCIDSPLGEVPDAPRHRGEQQRPSSARATPRTKVCVCVCACVCVCLCAGGVHVWLFWRWSVNGLHLMPAVCYPFFLAVPGSTVFPCLSECVCVGTCPLYVCGPALPSLHLYNFCVSIRCRRTSWLPISAVQVSTKCPGLLQWSTLSPSRTGRRRSSLSTSEEQCQNSEWFVWKYICMCICVYVWVWRHTYIHTYICRNRARIVSGVLSVVGVGSCVRVWLECVHVGVWMMGVVRASVDVGVWEWMMGVVRASVDVGVWEWMMGVVRTSVVVITVYR